MNPPQIGDASRDEVEIKRQAAEESARVDRARTYETDHLCLRCIHAPICAVVTAVRHVGAEGDIVISACGVFQEPQPSLAELLAAAEEEETNGE